MVFFLFLQTGAEGAVDAIRQVREMGANVALRDKEGWTALHWAAFHGQVGAAKELANESNLLAVKDKEGYTPIEMARKEGNDAVAQVYEKAQGESKKSK
jgi:ankyrin repeat protein